MPKTVILDAQTTNPGDLSWEWLKEYGELEIYPRTPKELIAKRCKGVRYYFAPLSAYKGN